MDLLALKRSLMPMSGPQDMGGGGGGGGQAANQTQTTELPEWARGYAKDTLAKGAALTDVNQNPYQTYTGQRVAGLSDLQNKAISQAGPEGFQKTVGSYMSPYQQNVTDIQKREAARQSGIAGLGQQAQAVQAGGFGGSRDAIMRAERERNLGQQMNDIQERGLQSAYGAATQQYNQGLNQLNTLGGLQQQQQQKGLDVAYQDFTNQQNYPYKQLGFMADMVRGIPVGQQTSIYGGQPNALGQLAGLGLGAYGISRMAEGGLTYADGGSVESTGNVEAIVSKLSDQQLQQSMEAAQARGDQVQMQIIQAEMAMRASERNGMAGAFNSLPQEAQDGMTEMAGGGVVAFADEGLVRGKPLPERATSPFGDFFRSIGAEDAVTSARELFNKINERKRQTDDARKIYPTFLESMTPTERKERTAAAERLMRGDQSSGKTLSQAELAAKHQEFMNTRSNPVPYDALTATRRVDYEQQPETKEDKKGKVTNPNSVVGQAKAAAKAAGVPAEDFEATMRRLRKEFEGEDAGYKKEELDRYKKAVDRLAENKSKAGYEALANFGFNMAAQASQPKPNRGQGLMGALQSAGAASPTLIQSMAESKKLNRASEDNLDKMRSDQLRFEQSLASNDRQSAMLYANAISQDKKAQEMLNIERQKLGLLGQQAANASTSGLGKVVSEMAQRDPEFAKLSGREQYKIASQIAGFSFRTDANNQNKFAVALEKKIGDDPNIKMLQIQMLGKTPEDQAKIQRQIDQRQMQIRSSLISTNPEFGEMAVGNAGTADNGGMRIVGVR